MQRSPRAFETRYILACGVATSITAAWAALLVLHVGGESASRTISNVGLIIAAFAGATGCLLAASRGDAHRRTWIFLACASISWGLGQVIWTVYESSGRGGAVPVLRGRRLPRAAPARRDRAPPAPERHPDPRRAHPDGDRRDDDRGSRVPLQLGRRSRRGLRGGRRRSPHDDDQPRLPARRRGADHDRHVRPPPRPRAPRSDHSRSG